MASISLRTSIRWLPAAASEPTSTLVLTSPGRHFVDVRILVPEHSGSTTTLESGNETLSPDRLDWAFGGTSASLRREDGLSHSRWHHWVDSRTVAPEDVVDEGNMFPQADGSTLETGRMVNPATGVETDYEEVWRVLEPVATGPDGTVKCVVLSTADNESRVRGRVIRLGQFCQGVLRVGDRVTVERWQWSEFRGWKRTAKIGDAPLPCAAVTNDKSLLVTGQVIKDKDYEWQVMESESS